MLCDKNNSTRVAVVPDGTHDICHFDPMMKYTSAVINDSCRNEIFPGVDVFSHFPGVEAHTEFNINNPAALFDLPSGTTSVFKRSQKKNNKKKENTHRH